MADPSQEPHEPEAAPPEPTSLPPVPKEKKRRRLTLRQQLLVANYTDPRSPTFGNGTQSYLLASPTVGSVDVARSTASTYLSLPNVQSAVQEAIEQNGLGYGFRFSALRKVIDGTYETVERTGDKVVRRTPRAAEVVKAIDIASKLAGDYERQRTERQVVSDRMRELMRRYKPDIRQGCKGKRREIIDADYVVDEGYVWVGLGGGLYACTA